jgi:hypothetical protein
VARLATLLLLGEPVKPEDRAADSPVAVELLDGPAPGTRRDDPPVRFRMAAAVVTLCIVAAGCSSPHPAATPQVGVVKGVATPCSDVPGLPPILVTATAVGTSSNRVSVAAKTTASANSGDYELELRPGVYLLSAPGSGMVPRTVTVQQGATLIEDFALQCT